MSYEQVKQYFTSQGLAQRVVVHEAIGDTVVHAAQVLGCTPAHIAKTMSFLVNEQVVLIVMAGDAKVDNKKFKAEFSKKAKMVPRTVLESRVGHGPGAVCPFALKPDVAVYLDMSLQRFKTVYTSGGSVNSTVKISPSELEVYAHPVKWVDVGKDWLPQVQAAG
ncbi:YbaK/EbsC family protein [Agrilactobacillus yilanensis]|uniref:YbaK/EbsC family protein n=1 Tax=Agrilactobacillus yilanensis TaxID=2485997 RepID=A0ABW4J7J2_9LACO|nr:YbaK/EbsC family protein [Agrilactobacillus yilanensis]